MSTLKSDSIQPVSNGNNLIFKTGVGDLERMRIQTTGKIVINNARADVGAGSVLTGQGAPGTIHFVQNAVNDNWVGMTTSATWDPTTSQGGILIQGSHGYGTKIHFLTTESYANGQKNRMTLDNFGSLGIGTSTPGASLDVNGTLKVGDFGGTTNVMVKPNNTANAVGQVIPILRGNYITNVAYQAVTALPAGTWFVYMTAADNSIVSGSNVDEDIHFCMAKVWTVPSGQFLRFGNLYKTPTSTDTTMGYWLDNSDTVKTSASGFTEFKTTATGDAKAWQSNGGNISATNAPSVFYDAGSADGTGGLVNWAGYAIRIA